MKNSKYWQKRFEQIEDSSNKIASQVAKETEKMFQEAEKEIEQEISVWYQRFATNNGIKIQDAKKLLKGDELKELKWTIDEYIKYGHENELNAQWMKELENASAKYHISRLEALKLQTRQTIEALYNNEEKVVSTMVERVYSDGYYHSLYEVQKGFNIGWDIGAIDENKLKAIVSKPWATDGKNFSDRIWQSKGQLINELHSELTRSCILGKAPDQAIKNIAKKFNTSKSQAGRLIMTEQAYFSSVAQQDVFKELDVEKYEIVATLDSRTSIICQDMDGHVFDMKDYSPGVTAPPFHPNCRTTTVPYFEDDFNVGERAAKDENGKTYYVPSNLKYADWKSKYVDNVDKTNNTVKIKSTTKDSKGINDPEMVKNNHLLSYSKDYIDLEDEDNLKMYNNLDKLNISVVNSRKRSNYSGIYKRIEIPNSEDLDSVLTTWHELGHAIDNFDKRMYMSNNRELNEALSKFNVKDGIPEAFSKYLNNLKSKASKKLNVTEKDIFDELKQHYAGKLSDDVIERAAKERLNSKIVNKMRELSKTDKEFLGYGTVSDILSCLSKGKWNNTLKNYGYHEKSYLNRDGMAQTELYANYTSLRMLNMQEELSLIKEIVPDVYSELENLYKEMGNILEGLK